eukprot:467940_1
MSALESPTVELHMNNTNINSIKSRSPSPNDCQFTYSTTQKPNRCIAITWFLWHTFDFGTDIATTMQWIFGLVSTQYQTQHCATDRNALLHICGPLLLTFSVIGYVCYLYDAYKQNILLKSNDRNVWNYLKIAKMWLEDFVSILITILVTWIVFQPTLISTVSLSVSSLSWIVMMFKHTIYNPRKYGKDNCDKCGGFVCCMCWIIFILGLLIWTFVVILNQTQNGMASEFHTPSLEYEMRVITVNDYCEHVNVMPNGTFFVYYGFVSYGGQYNVNCYLENLDRNGIYCSFFREFNDTYYVEYQSCERFLSNVTHTDDFAICYDNLEPRL